MKLIMLLLLIVFLVIIYLYFGNAIENFTSPSQTSLVQQSSGTSKLFNWPVLNKLKTYTRKCPSSTEEETSSDPSYPQPETTSCPSPAEEKICCPQQEVVGGCSGCDITQHPDIDQYVLKSSVPPCPDLRNYALKSDMSPDVDMSKYILKSEIEACPPKQDLSDYVHKNSIPACPPVPKCPVCPVLSNGETCEEVFNKTVKETSEFNEEESSEAMETALTNGESNSNNLTYNSLCGSEMEACNLGNGTYASYSQGVKPITTVPVDGLNPKTNYPLQRI